MTRYAIDINIDTDILIWHDGWWKLWPQWYWELRIMTAASSMFRVTPEPDGGATAFAAGREAHSEIYHPWQGPIGTCFFLTMTMFWTLSPWNCFKILNYEIKWMMIVVYCQSWLIIFLCIIVDIVIHTVYFHLSNHPSWWSISQLAARSFGWISAGQVSVVRSENDRQHWLMLRDVPESRRKVVLKIIKKAGFVGNISANYGFAMICPTRSCFHAYFPANSGTTHGTIGGFSLFVQQGSKGCSWPTKMSPWKCQEAKWSKKVKANEWS